MKKIMVAILLCTLTAATFAQPDTVMQVRKKTQLSFSVSLQNVAIGDGKSSTSFLLAPRIGFFVYEGLQIEPEGVLLLGSADAAYMLNANLVYNFFGTGKAVPFLLAGYGIANTIPVYNIPIYSPGFTVGVLNLGAGIKAFVSDNVAFRGEYRYQKFSGEGKTQVYYLGYSNAQKLQARIHSFQFGIIIIP